MKPVTDECKVNCWMWRFIQNFCTKGDRVSVLIVKQYKRDKQLGIHPASCMHYTQHDQVELAAKNPSQSQELLLP